MPHVALPGFSFSQAINSLRSFAVASFAQRSIPECDTVVRSGHEDLPHLQRGRQDAWKSERYPRSRCRADGTVIVRNEIEPSVKAFYGPPR